jgi:hypothetical protein
MIWGSKLGFASGVLLFVALIALLIAGAGKSASAETSGCDANCLARRLPHEFCGNFAWRADGIAIRVRYHIAQIGIVGGSVEFGGEGLYDSGRGTHIRIRGTADPVTRSIEIFESEPDQPMFVIDGSHKGDLSTDLGTIRAEWTTRMTGDKGDLVLSASCTMPIS